SADGSARAPTERTRRSRRTRARRRIPPARGPPRAPRRSPARPSHLPTALHVAIAVAAFDAEVAAREVVVVGGVDAHDRIVLDVKREVAADPAVRTHGVDLGLLLFAPVTRLAQVELALRHQRTRRADRDAVAAVDAGRLGQRDVELGRDV